MKSKQTDRTAVVLLIFLGLTRMTAAAAPAADNENKANPGITQSAPTSIDPATGLPVPAIPPSPWKDPGWKDPEKVLREVGWDNIPVGNVVEQLRRDFNQAFDVLIPNSWQGPGPNNPAMSFDPHSVAIKMQLKNVKASEVFNAMNLLFESENSPCRWELKLNGTRPIAILRVLPELLPPVAPSPRPPPTVRMVYFVGDLIGDEKSGGLTMEKLVKTVSEVYQMSYGPPKGVLQFHNEAQLLIVTGTGGQISFVQQTLGALREKARAEHKPQPKADELKAKAEETKAR